MADTEAVKMEDVIRDLEQAKTWSENRALEDKYEKTFMKILNSFSENDKKNIGRLLSAAIRNGSSAGLENIAKRILQKRKLIDFKNQKDLIDKMLADIKASALDEDEENSKHFTGFMEEVMETLQSHKVLGRHEAAIFEITKTALSHYEDPKSAIHNAALPCITKFPWSDYPDRVVEAMKLLATGVMSGSDFPSSCWYQTNAGIIMPMMFRVGSGPVISIAGKKVKGLDGTPADAPEVSSVHMRCVNDVAKMFKYCINQDWKCAESPDDDSIYYVIATSVLEDFLSAGSTSPELVKPMMNDIKELWECGDATLERDANYIMTAMAGKDPDLLGEQTDDLIEQFLNGKQPSIITSLSEMYNNQPEKFHPHMSRFVTMTVQTDEYSAMSLVSFLTVVAKANPQVFTNKDISSVVGLISSTSMPYGIAQFLEALAVKRLNDVTKYDDIIIKAMSDGGPFSAMGANLLVKFATNEQRASKYLKTFASLLPKVDTNYRISLISSMRTIGITYPKVLAQHRKLFENYSKYPDLKDMCQSAIDVIEGRSLKGISEEVNEQRQDIDNLDTRVTETEDKVETISTDVNQNKQDIATAKKDIVKHDERLDQVEQDVDVIETQVEELDHKTLSHAPAWSRDVSKLLNPASEHDWRLLASRLGYTADDIRNWATQPDPCLSMFDEWFATHKTREATFGVLKALQEMNRIDAAIIVENALKAVEGVVEEDEEEVTEPPPVFLSYQWGHQPEVKLLKKHLEMAGYNSWMDIGQMGGGDKLFAKIDAGIRAAKLIVCCVTEKYASSPNCNREVNLSVTLGKPVIPLLMEKMSWPPPGAMGPIFGEYLFIRFFQRPGEETKDERYWSPDKFTELLMQLRYQVAPEVDLISGESPYKEWWKPPEEVIVIKPRQQQANEGSNEKATEKAVTASPELFISYQWGKQPQIKSLYNRLSSVGYNCWLDILQMGGGDSLYDKIDRGIRGCKVVLSCVTSKYALSANCRREVSLADAIKKPIIPLLLEDSSWPPEGPMGLVFTQLLYIQFTRPNADIQNHWKCPEFDELLAKIKLHSQPSLQGGEIEKPKKSETPAATKKSSNSSQIPKKTTQTAPKDDKKSAPPRQSSNSSSVKSPVPTSSTRNNTTTKTQDKPKITQPRAAKPWQPRGSIAEKSTTPTSSTTSKKEQTKPDESKAKSPTNSSSSASKDNSSKAETKAPESKPERKADNKVGAESRPANQSTSSQRTASTKSTSCNLL